MKEEAAGNKALKYRKIYNWGKTLIVSGMIKKGDRFPSEHLLEKKFGYSRQTIRMALGMLEMEGLIEKRRGSGTYVLYQMENKEAKTVGLILSYFADYLFPQIYDGIASVMKEQEIGIDLAVTKNDLNKEALYLEGFLHAGVSGLIVEGTKSTFPNPNVRLYQKFLERNIPVIFIHNHYENMPFHSIEMSDAKCSHALTKQLLLAGHRQICGIFKYDDVQGIERYRGFMECMTEHGLSIDDDMIRWYSTKDASFKLSKTALSGFLKKTRGCTAMMVYNDELAYQIRELAWSRGIGIPEKLSMVSFDDATLFEESAPILSAVHPKLMLGRLAAKNLIKMMGDENWQNHSYSYRFPVRLNAGASIRNIAKKRHA